MLVISSEVLWSETGAKVVIEAHFIDVEATRNIARLSVLKAGHD
jgi:hypothetical protein